ncbi:CHAT domain-containing protein [Terricaulis silvestris]|uniref:CHAT domain protein n=1 Tax=Terricaulis silvestris TaxID=2686094 RepID=A0A6I6MIQ2_9CAUL|nr:CHAT domain-containing protein [Terricaulis silvestris]QGZ93641.1 CHAT domain protein [Terricaulis silvestris]
MAISLRVLTGGRQSTVRFGADELTRLSRYDRNWVRYGDSAQLAHLLYKLADRSDRTTLLEVCRLVVDTFWGTAGMTGLSLSETYANLCGAAALTLANPDVFSRMAMTRGETSVLMLHCAALAPGGQREEWAQIGLRETRLHGAQALQTWTRDNITGRFIAVGTAVAGDHRAAAAQYLQVLANSTGAMQDLVEQRQPAARTIGELAVNGLENLWNRATGGTHLGGLAATVAGIRMLRAEAATLAFVTGEQDRAIDLLELSRGPGVGAVANETSTSARTWERQLTGAGVTLVQVATTQIGCFCVVSVQRRGRIVRSHALDYAPGGAAMLDIMGGWRSGFSRHPGLLQQFDQAHRASARRIEREMMEYVGLASGAAKELAGNTILTALASAGVAPTGDVLVIQPASLASLPLGLSVDADGVRLAQRYKVRFATSLESAARSAERVAQPSQSAPTIAHLVSRGRDAPRYAPFEIAAVEAHFAPEARRAPVAASNSANALQPLVGAQYWHLATHGVWNFRNQDQSGLLVIDEDDPTTVAHVSAFHADPAPRLVFLSACETNLINTERDLNDFVGLNTAFMKAGAAGVIGTQWAVSDAASALLATRFYASHIAGAMAPAAALQEAQNWLRAATPSELMSFIEGLVASGKVSAEASEAILGFLSELPSGERPFEDPYFWGGFQLLGG